MKQTLLLILSVVLVACGSDNDPESTVQEPKPVEETAEDIADEAISYPPFNVMKISEEDFMKVFTEKEWKFCYARYNVSDDGRWQHDMVIGGGHEELYAYSDGTLKGIAYGEEDRQNATSYNYRFDEKTQTLSFPHHGAPHSAYSQTDTLRVISANEELVVLATYDEREKTNFVYVLQSKNGGKHQPTKETKGELLPTKKVELEEGEFMKVFKKYVWTQMKCYGIYADGTMGEWDGKDTNYRYFYAPDETSFKEYYTRNGRKVYRVCPFSYDEKEGCLVFQKEQMPTSFAGYSNKVYVQSVNDLYGQIGSIVLYEEAPRESGFRYILHAFMLSESRSKANQLDRQYTTLDQ